MENENTHLCYDLPRLKATLQQTGGNISRAAAVLGVTKPWAMNLVRRFQLNEWARELRGKSGMPLTGRPRKIEIDLGEVVNAAKAAVDAKAAAKTKAAATQKGISNIPANTRVSNTQSIF